MSSACDVQCSEDIIAEEELHKGVEFSYTREFLLSLAELETCKRLPNGFDSSILCELENASTGSSSCYSSDSDYGKRDLSQDLQPENGCFGRGTLLRGPGCVVEASALNVCGYLPLHNSTLNDASTESGRSDGSLSQHSQLNPERGLLGRGALLRKSVCPLGVSSPMVQGNSYHLLNRSVTPYRPPHLCKMNLHSRTERKDLTTGRILDSSKSTTLERQEDDRSGRDSLELQRKEHNPIAEKQHNLSYEHKENLEPDAHPKVSRDDKGILGECYQSAPNNAGRSSKKVSSHGGKLSPISSSESMEKGFQTKCLNNFPTQEHYDVKVDQTEISMLSSTSFIDQFTGDEKKPAGGSSMGNENHESKAYSESKICADENDSTSFSWYRAGVSKKLMATTTPSATEEVTDQLCSSDTSFMCSGHLRHEESDHSNQCQCIQFQDVVEKQSNAASNCGLDATDLAEAPSKLNSSGVMTTGNPRHNLTCGIAMGNGTNESEVCPEANRSVSNCESQNFFSGRNASEVYSSNKSSNEQESTSFSSQSSELPHKLMAPVTPSTTEKVSEQLSSSSTSAMPAGIMCKEITQFSASGVTENQFSQHQSIECFDIGKAQSNTAGHSGSPQLLDLFKKGKDEIDPAAAFAKLNSSNARTTGNIELIEKHFSEHQRLECYDMKNTQSTIASHSGSSQHLLNLLKRHQDLVSSEVDNKLEMDSPREQELQFLPVCGCDEKANANEDICLPDEDSLITLEDLVFQMDSVLKADGNSTDPYLVAPRTSANNAQNPAIKAKFSADRSPSNLGNVILASDDVVSSKTSYHYMGARQSYPRSNTNPGKLLFHHSDFCSLDSKVDSYGPIRHSVRSSFPQQMIIPGGFSHRLNSWSTGMHSDLTQNFTRNYEQQVYGMPNPGHTNPIGGNYNQAVVNKELLGTEKAKQIHLRWPWSRNV